MAKVEIARALLIEIKRKFKGESHKILDLMENLSINPKKGKSLGVVGGIVIKELKYKNFRFYFITDSYNVKFLKEEDLVDLLIRFVRMSDKKDQEKIILEIKKILRDIGPKGFD